MRSLWPPLAPPPGFLLGSMLVLPQGLDSLGSSADASAAGCHWAPRLAAKLGEGLCLSLFTQSSSCIISWQGCCEDVECVT